MLPRLHACTCRYTTISYSITFDIPNGGYTSWLRTYMSVVLAITAAIVVCILFTLLRHL